MEVRKNFHPFGKKIYYGRETKIAVCEDWCIGYSVEVAFLSTHGLAQSMKKVFVVKNIIIGANSSLGKAFVTQLCDAPGISSLHAFSRTKTQFPSPKVNIGHIDLDDKSSIAKAADRISQEDYIDFIIVATGSLHKGTLKPEKSLRELSKEKFDYFFLKIPLAPL